MEKYNNLLVEFEFLIDLDIAIYRMLKEESNSSLLNKDIFSLKNEYNVIERFLYREHINPLEILLNADPDDVLDLYNNLITKDLDKLLKYAVAYETFALMITYLNNASSISITVLCENELQEQFIKKLNNRLYTIVVPSRDMVNLDDYNIIYTKYFANILGYGSFGGKHIYIANAAYNFEKDFYIPSLEISALYTDVNTVHSMDLYRNIKYIWKPVKEIKENEDL